MYRGHTHHLIAGVGLNHGGNFFVGDFKIVVLAFEDKAGKLVAESFVLIIKLNNSFGHGATFVGIDLPELGGRVLCVHVDAFLGDADRGINFGHGG